MAPPCLAIPRRWWSIGAVPALAAASIVALGRCAPGAGSSTDPSCACSAAASVYLDAGFVGPDAAGPADFTAQMVVASESCPFDLANPSSAWFSCPHPLAHRLDRMPDLPVTRVGGTAPARILIDPQSRHQTILGTGTSLEESTVANLLALSDAKRAEVLRALADPGSGAGMNLFRLTMGTSDFTGTDWYTYDDLPPGAEDPDLVHFSIQRDIELGIVGILEQVLSYNPRAVFFASPWSPPGWMKDNGQITGWLFGGSLRTDAIPVYAKYFRRFVEAYANEGIPIYAVTLQNEPRNSSALMPTCLVTPEQEAGLAKAVKQEFAAAGLATKVWVYDQNFDVGLDYVRGIFADRAALAAVDGVAFHDYAGDPSAMSAIQAAYPGMDMLFTEKALWGVAGVDRAAQYFRNGARSYVSWVTLLDQNGGPNRGPNSEKPRRFVRSLAGDGTEYWPTAEYFLFSLYSRFVPAGAVRIDSTYGSTDTVTTVAFADPDGTMATVVVNQTSTAKQFALESEGNQVWASLDPRSAAAILWRSGLGASVLDPVAP